MTVSAIPRIETDRLILRGPVLGDFDAYAGVVGSERSRYIGGPLDRRDAWREFAAEAALWMLRGCGLWTLEEKSTRAVVGWAGIYYPDHYDEPELGWSVTEDFEGHGLAYEGANAARDCAAQAYGLSGLISFIAAGNQRSIRLADRLEATCEREGQGPFGPFVAYRHPAPETTQ